MLSENDKEILVIDINTEIIVTDNNDTRLPLERLIHEVQLSDNNESLSLLRSIFDRYSGKLIKVITQYDGEFLVKDPIFFRMNGECFCTPSREDGFFLKRIRNYSSIKEDQYTKSHYISFRLNKSTAIAIREVSKTYENDIYSEFLSSEDLKPFRYEQL